MLLLSCRCRHMVRERAKPDMMHYPLPVQAGTQKSIVEPFMTVILLHRNASFLRPWHHLWLQSIHERDQSGIASCEKVRYSAEGRGEIEGAYLCASRTLEDSSFEKIKRDRPFTAMATILDAARQVEPLRDTQLVTCHSFHQTSKSRRFLQSL